MYPPELVVHLRLEKVRLACDYASKEADVHKHRYLQLFATSFTVGLAAVASVVLEKVAPLPGLAFAAAMFASALYIHVRSWRSLSSCGRASTASSMPSTG